MLVSVGAVLPVVVVGQESETALSHLRSLRTFACFAFSFCFDGDERRPVLYLTKVKRKTRKGPQRTRIVVTL
jgi:hypothetical protein